MSKINDILVIDVFVVLLIVLQIFISFGMFVFKDVCVDIIMLFSGDKVQFYVCELLDVEFCWFYQDGDCVKLIVVIICDENGKLVMIVVQVVQLKLLVVVELQQVVMKYFGFGDKVVDVQVEMGNV